MKRLGLLLIAVGLASCVDVDVDPDETKGNLTPPPAMVEFDPSASIIPLPNSLLIGPVSGTLNLPEQCNETATSGALRTGVLNQLDGFGTFEPLGTMTFTSPVDPDSIGSHFMLLKRKVGDTDVDPADAEPVPVTVFPSTTLRDDADCTSKTPVNNLTFVPNVPLDQDSVYTAVLTRGLEDEDGNEFVPSPIWALIRQSENPVIVDDGGHILSEETPLDPTNPDDVETLLGLSLLWRVHAPLLAFVDQATDVSREDILLAWDFKTQTVTLPLELGTEGTPAANLPTTTPLLGPTGDPGMTVIASAAADPGSQPPDVFDAVNPAICPSTGVCDSVGAIYSGAFLSHNYLQDTPNPLSDGAPVPGMWDDPLAPTKVGDVPITVTAFVPNDTEPMDGWPVVIFGHGITRSRLDVFAIASQLTSAGFAVIAFDWVLHGDPNSPLGAGRAVQIDDTSPQCQDAPDPTDRTTGGITCYAPFLSSSLGADRDYFRQSVLDAQALVNALELCTGDACGTGFNINPERIGYLAQSLGGIIGTVFVAQEPAIEASVLNVTGVGIVDIIENTRSKELQCPLVDALIDAGVLTGSKSDLQAGTGACFTDFTSDPAWIAFANIARWVLDPADGANYTAGLTGRAVFVQEVNDDGTVPNVATDTLAALLGLTSEAAAVATGLPPAATSAVISGAGMPLLVTYYTVDTPASNVYDHGSLLAPADESPGAGLGTAQMQTDAFTYLSLSL